MKKMNLTQVVTGFAILIFPITLDAAVNCGGMTRVPPGCPMQWPISLDIDNGTRCEYPAVPCGQTGKQGISCPCTDYTTSQYKCFCNAGYKGSNGTSNLCSCGPCPANTYSESENTGCIPCPANSTSPAGSSRCRCTNGHYMDKTNTCVRCPAGAKDSRGGAVHGSTPATGGSTILDCFLPANTSYYEPKGVYRYKNNCKYSGLMEIIP